MLMFVALFAVPSEVMATSAQKELTTQVALDGYYNTRDGNPFWVSHGRVSRKADILVQTLDKAWEHGLNPHAYKTEQIKAMIRDLKNRQNSSQTDRKLLELELFLSGAFAKYTQDMSGMRVKAEELGLDPEHWRQPVSAGRALSFLTDDMDLQAFLKNLEPKGQTYQALKEELIRLVEQEAIAPEQKELVSLEGILKPGRGSGSVPAIRKRMGLEEVDQVHTYTYDDALATAVMAFQAQNGLVADGIIGPKTIQAMNRGRKEKIAQLIANLERLRWLGEDKPQRFIVVNLPGETLWAIDDGKVAIEMPVVIGRPERETQSFRTFVSGVRLNPEWTVPPTILEEDILPKLKEDSAYLSDKGIEIYDGYAADAPTLDPTSIDWNNITRPQLHALRFVQIPGDHNPLGRIRILMPNRYNIYLHDTNHRELFAAADRAQSSGCVRMKYPEEIANFVLKGKADWGNEQMLAILKEGKTVDINAPEKIPVYLLYYTVWLGSDGKITYGEDIYQKDKKLLYALKNIDGIPVFRYHNNKVAIAAE